MEVCVSIIMGIYNCEKTIEKAINSILNQSFAAWELIMCDDGSTDGTLEIARGYQKRYANIQVIRNEKNMGLAYSLNQCISVSKGKYIARMDADDESLKNRLETQVAFLDKNSEIDIVGTSIIVDDKKGRKYVRKYPHTPMQQMIWKSTPFAHPTVVVRREVYETLKGYTVSKETTRCEDLDLWYRCKISGYDGVNLDMPLYIYSESSEDYKRRDLKAALGIMRITRQYYKILHVPLFCWILIYKPVISSCIPSKLMMWYHRKKG